ncbi:SET domain-containing protein [Mycena venus]|uniref:SET domain-containing protein n=1 Tax=Mycena venus TaxID=2733690 RepID=A0A8H6X524_9AGAR|nr:SET domain-containing protein [Mycena venus]
MPTATRPSMNRASSSESSIASTSASTSYLRRDRCRPPPLQFCAQMNADIRSNPVLDSPYFDLAGHIGNRAYCLHNVAYADSPTAETVTLLDVGVKDLLPVLMPAPTVLSPKGVTFAIRHSEGRGWARHVRSAEYPQRPILVAPYIIALQTHSEADIYAALLHRLSADTRMRFMELANCKPAEECGTLEGIMRTNAIGISLNVPDVPHPELATHRGIFLNISRCNHSCGPNAKWQWDPASFSLSLVALRPIHAGQEITVAYITPTCSRTERRAKLKAIYNFSCRCEFCARPASLTFKSDAARAELVSESGLPSFENWCLDANIPDHALIDAHMRAVSLIEAEGLQTLDSYGKHLDAIAMGYGALRDVEGFREWAWRAMDFRPMDSGASRVLENWILDPETFPVWGWRTSPTPFQRD